MRHIAPKIVFASVLMTSLQISQSAYAKDINTRYTISIAGILIGSADVTTSLDGNNYHVQAKGRTAGISRLVSNGKGTLFSKGRIKNGRPYPSSYTMETLEAKKNSTVNMSLKNGSIKQLTAKPASSIRPDRVPVETSHKHDVIDPLSGLLVSITANTHQDACNRTIPIFDGWQRFDIKLSYKKTRPTPRGTTGLADTTIICSARYKPISGHRSKKKTTKYLAKSKDYELWLTPVIGTNLMTPTRLRIGTKYGALVLKAKKINASG